MDTKIKKNYEPPVTEALVVKTERILCASEESLLLLDSVSRSDYGEAEELSWY